MKNHFKNVFAAILLLFLSSYGFSIDIDPIIPLDGVRWSMEATKGFQSIDQGLMSKENGSNSYINHVLEFRGVLFHSYYDELLFTKAQFNIGFLQKTHFFWTDKPDFLHESDLNSLIRCLELDVQKLIPFPINYWITVSPFGSYSFFQHSTDMEEIQNGIYSSRNMYNSVLAGINISTKTSKIFSQNFFLSYSPLVYLNYKRSKIQFLNYGFELMVDASRFKTVLFYNHKKAFHQRRATWFTGIIDDVNNSEFGFSISISMF